MAFNKELSRTRNIFYYGDIAMKYNDKQRRLAVESRLGKIINSPQPDYPAARNKSHLVSKINGVKIVVILEPYRKNITQWRVTINGKLFNEHCGMTRVYEELARRNPPARDY